MNDYIGMNIIKRSESPGILIEIWQEDPTEKKPDNVWKKINSWCELNNKFEPPSDHQIHSQNGLVKEDKKDVKT